MKFKIITFGAHMKKYFPPSILPQPKRWVKKKVDDGFYIYEDLWEKERLEAIREYYKSLPPCPECGNKNLMSYGIKWYCRECGRQFMKKYRKKNREEMVGDMGEKEKK